MTDDGKTTFYQIDLGSSAVLRGDRVVFELLGWAGSADSLARVRVVGSTVPAYHRGQVGLVERGRLIPIHRRPAA